MSSGLPHSGSPRASASLPPAGLPGLDPRFSRLVDVPESGGARSTRQWHVLDNGPELERLGVTPAGTILCVHGNPTWSYLWRSLVTAATDAAARAATDASSQPATDAPANAAAAPAGPATAPAGWRVIAVDQLEMGFSERTGYSRSLEQRVRDLGDLTDALRLEGPVITFGHDWGGVISLGWAVEHPDLLAGVMLLNTAVHQPEDAPVPAPLRLALARPVLGLATVGTPGFLETTLALAHPPLAAEVKDAYRAPYQSAERRGGIGAFVADIPVDARHESRGELDRIADAVRGLTVPALLLWGPRDPIFSDRYLDDLIDRLPQADVHRYEGAGHLLAEDVDYAAAALAWLAERGPGATAAASSPAHGATGGGATGGGATDGTTRDGAADARPPLWHQLDQLAESGETALVEMVPSPGAPPRRISWRLLATRVRQLAAGLSRAGVRPGDRVSLLVPPGADLTAVLYACLRLGAVVVVADAGLGLPGLTRAVRGARPKHLIGALPGLTAARALGWPGQRISTARFPAPVARALGVSHSLADLVALGTDAALPPEPAPGDIAAILFTSGSTGPAKGVVYTHEQLAAVRDAIAAQYGVGVGSGLVAGFAPFALLGPALGARSVTPDMDVTRPRTLTATAVADAIAEADAHTVFLSPAAVANVVATSNDLTPEGREVLGTVRTFLSAGAPVSERLLAATARLMPDARLHTPYGMTEGLLMTDVTLEGIRDAGTDGPGGVCVGVAAPTTTVRISALDAAGDATGEPTDAPGVTGEIVVSAPHLKDHYDRLWLTNRAAVDRVPRAGRWHRTGDVGHLDAAGRLWVEGRLPHVITTPDGPLTPVGTEQRIESVPAVLRAALVGVGPQGVQQPVAIVETRLGTRRVGLASPELSAAVRRASQQDLAAVLVVPRLPTDIRHNSKIDRSRLAAWAGGILAGGRMRRP